MIRASCTLTNHFGVAKAALTDHLARTLSETSRDIAQSTRENMRPGWFLDTRLSQDETRALRIALLIFLVQVPTAYALFPEQGTVRQAAHPVLIPAIMQHWPSSLERHWAVAGLPDAGPIVSPMDAISRDDRRTGQGYS